MNLTQNDRLKQVTSDTLIVGVDVGSQTHFCRAFDWRGFELSRRVFKFSNTGMGFLTFLRWTEELMNKTEMKKVIVGCEPTGCYWLTFQKFLQEHEVQLVTVNPFTVNRSMELDDNSPEKSDLKDPKTIALLVKDGRYSTSYLPSGVYAEIREASVRWLNPSQHNTQNTLGKISQAIPVSGSTDVHAVSLSGPCIQMPP